jgi:hypothetical protein
LFLDSQVSRHYDRASLPFTVHGGMINESTTIASWLYPGSHSYKNCLVSSFWSCEAKLGMLIPGKVALEDEANTDGAI